MSFKRATFEVQGNQEVKLIYYQSAIHNLMNKGVRAEMEKGSFDLSHTTMPLNH